MSVFYDSAGDIARRHPYRGIGAADYLHVAAAAHAADLLADLPLVFVTADGALGRLVARLGYVTMNPETDTIEAFEHAAAPLFSP